MKVKLTPLATRTWDNTPAGRLETAMPIPARRDLTKGPAGLLLCERVPMWLLDVSYPALAPDVSGADRLR